MPYEKVFRKFEVAGVRYLVVGGIAVNLHGYACVTVDLDRMLDLSRDNFMLVVDSLDKMGYVPHSRSIPEIWCLRNSENSGRKRRGTWSGCLLTQGTVRQVDLFSDNPVDFERRIGGCGGLSSAAFEFRPSRSRIMIAMKGATNVLATGRTCITSKKSNGKKRSDGDPASRGSLLLRLL